jgi:molybdopterin molybdotransferase
VTPVRPIRGTISIDEARELLFGAVTPIARTERVALGNADGRVLAEAVVSRVDVPPFDRAAMDGYAVIAEDTFGASASAPRTLLCLESVYTGQVASMSVVRGTCIEIATGAPLPEGADAVVMVEETERGAGDSVRVLTPVYPTQHVGRRATDIGAGQPILSPGDLLTPSRIGALAAAGIAHVSVYARPRVAILSTGNEIVEPGQPLQPGQIYDINRFTLAAVIDAHGGVAVAYPTVGDTLPELTAAVTGTAEDDVLVFSGGSSVGRADGRSDLPRHRRQTGKAHRTGPDRRATGARNARQSHFVSVQRLLAARSDAASHGQAARASPAGRSASARTARGFDDRTAPVLYRAR